jgi:hypothetical protein
MLTPEHDTKKSRTKAPSPSLTAGKNGLEFQGVGHWVGDIHQPLHVSFEDDRGGNSVLVTGLCDGVRLAHLLDAALGK